MASFQDQKQRLLRLMGVSVSYAKQWGEKEVAKQIADAAQHLAEGKLLVVVAGEFKRGKSSLINALLETPGLFPVEVDITTSIVSTITYAKEEKITIVLGERGSETARPIRREEIANYVTEQKNPGNRLEAKMLVIESPNEKLIDGLTLVDTPGVGSINQKHTAISYAFIPNADVILFVGYALEPFSTDELAFLSERIMPHCQNVIFVITHIDKNADYQTVLQNNREKLTKVTGWPAEKINLIPVSSQLMLDYLKYGEEIDLQESNYPTLQAELWSLLTRERGSILTMRALTTLSENLATLRTPLQAEWDVYTSQSQQELDRQETEFRALKEKLNLLTRADAEWRSQLNYGLDDLRTEMISRLQHGMIQVRRKETKYLDDDRLLKKPENIIVLLEKDVNALVVELEKELSRQGAELHSQLIDSTGLSLSSEDIYSINRRQTTPLDRKVERTGALEKALRVARNAGFSTSVGASVGAFIGGVAGGIIGGIFGAGVGAVPGTQIGATIGGLLGGVGGLSTGTRMALAETKQKDKQPVSQMTRSFLEETNIACTEALNKSITGLNRSIREEVQQAINSEANTVKQTLESLEKARKRSQEEAAKRKREIEPKLSWLAKVQAEVEEIAQQLAHAVPEATPPPEPAAASAAEPQQPPNKDSYADWADEQ